MGDLRSRFHRRGAPTPRGYRASEYKRWFPTTATVFLRYLKHHRALPVHDGQEGPAIGVVVVPWVSTAAPWYAIMLAIGLARRRRKVALIWDDTAFPERFVGSQNEAIARVLGYVGRFLPVTRLSEEASHPGAQDDARALDNLTEQVAAWCLRGAPPTDRDLPKVEAMRAGLALALPLVRGALSRSSFDSLLVPGGVYGNSGVFRLAAAEHGVRVATFDADRGVAQLCVSGVAAQNADLPQAFEALWNSDDDTKAQAIAIARVEFQSRAEGSDRYGYQTVREQASALDGARGCVLMPLNVEWDTAALGRHAVFDDTVDWLTSTIPAILDANVGPVIVRQHPSERRQQQRSKLDVAAILRERLGDDPGWRFVGAEEPVSSYDLLRSAKVVLPFTSNIGIEAAAIGKTSLVSGACFYANLGFVWSAGSRDEYLDLLRRALSADLPAWPDQVDRAWICYYLVAVRNRIWTDFTARPDDFWSWCRRPPDTLFAEPEVSDMLEAIDRGVPVALLRHRRSLVGAP